MATPLPGLWSLIADSWKAFIKTWDTTVKYSSWLILVGLLKAIMTFFTGGSTANAGNFIIAGLIWICALILGLWATILLYQAVIALEAGAKPGADLPTTAWMILPSFALVALLEGLAVGGATLLLIIPGIYVGTRLAFSELSFLDKGLKAGDALANSWALTKNRFWAIFGRQLGAGILFGLAVGVLAILAMIVVGSVSGFGRLTEFVSGDGDSPSTNAMIQAVSSIVQAAVVPLVIIFQVKLYKALEKTRA